MLTKAAEPTIVKENRGFKVGIVPTITNLVVSMHFTTNGFNSAK